jgi:hypothetical protein
VSFLWFRYVGDRKSRNRAKQLRDSAGLIANPRRDGIIGALSHTVFVSHTSKDDDLIRKFILPVVSERFFDPFFHSYKTGGQEQYLEIVGLSLLAAPRVLSIWSQEAARSDFFLAEQYLVSVEGKSNIIFCINAGYDLRRRMVRKNTPTPELCIIDARPDMRVALDELRRALRKWPSWPGAEYGPPAS